ncbi:zinc-binding alcohol dehydrogenase [Pelagivirga sediminicola]|uniref:alcohol dehydrogenase n=1 Tax=Pelagivirga sediminicola TaxID=2170575 RepID=A0A2T7G5S8_9RHOB|nr:alcohol dehydrogenase catalytic domain-containing protein [Pelagivirga sediminicola]PVA09789.1 zinc-binding alcohol dehydrogenase [Pelagivirga sediminicola]
MTDTLPLTMKAAICPAPGAPVEIREVAMPTPGAGQVLVQMETCGVCHSDLHLREGQENLPDSLYPLVLGHEGIGRVVQIGAGTKNAPEIGTRIGLPWIFETCMQCKPCRTGHEALCAAGNARGVQKHGAFAQYALCPADFAVEIPEEIDPLRGAPLLCAGLMAWSALRKTRLEAGTNVLIIGAGGLGQYAILIAKVRGARVMVVDRDPSKLKTAKRLGADVIVPTGEDAGAEIRQAGGADVTLNFAPSPAIWPMIEAAANPMSDIVAVAMVHDPMPLSMMWLINGGHRVFGSSVGSRQELADFLAFAAAHPLRVEVQAIALEDVNAALDALKAGDVAGRLCIDFAQ